MSKPILGLTLRESAKKKDGTSPVVASLSLNGTTRYYPMGMDCKPSDFKFINSLVPDMTEDEGYEAIRKTLRLRLKRFANLVKPIEFFDFTGFGVIWDKNKESIYLPEDEMEVETPKDVKLAERAKVMTKGVPDLFKICDEVVKTKKKGTKAWYTTACQALRRYLGPERYTLPVTDVNVAFLKDVDLWMESNGHNDGGPLLDNSINGYLRAIKALFNVAIKDYGIMQELFPFATDYKDKHKFLIRPGKKRFRILKDPELQKIFKVRYKDPQWEMARKMFLAAYMANGTSGIDLFTLRWEDWDGDIITYERHKTRDMHPIPIKIKITVIKELKDILLEYATEDRNRRNFILSFIDSKLGYDDLRSKVAQLLADINPILALIAEDLGIEKFTMYDARHAWAYKSLINGMPFTEIMQGLGHSNPKTTLRYLHDLDDTQRKEYATMLVQFNVKKKPGNTDAAKSNKGKGAKVLSIAKSPAAAETKKRKRV